MKWIVGKLEAGDHIRVKRDFYYHHGVFVGDGVVHFTAENDDGVNGNPEDIIVRKTSLDFFANNGNIEKLELSFFEKRYKRNIKEVLKLANGAIGNSGYDFIHNNCEDFANKCCYKRTMTSQILDIKKKI